MFLGQVSKRRVAVDSSNHVFVFLQRAEKILGHHKTHPSPSPHPLLVAASGKLWRPGAKPFPSNPHGLRVDAHDNVGSHDRALNKSSSFLTCGETSLNHWHVNALLASTDATPFDTTNRHRLRFRRLDLRHDRLRQHRRGKVFSSDGKFLFDWGRKVPGPANLTCAQRSGRCEQEMFTSPTAAMRAFRFSTQPQIPDGLEVTLLWPPVSRPSAPTILLYVATRRPQTRASTDRASFSTRLSGKYSPSGAARQ